MTSVVAWYFEHRRGGLKPANAWNLAMVKAMWVSSYGPLSGF